MRIALVGNLPPPYGGVSVHVSGLARALRSRGAEVRVLDIGEGEHRGDGVLPARGPLRYARRLAEAAAQGFLLHVHTSGANPKSWLVALAASRARRPNGPRPLLTLHSGLSVGWLAAGSHRPALARAACAGFGRILAVNLAIASALRACRVPAGRIEILPAFFPALLDPGAPPGPLGIFRGQRAPLYCAAVAPGSTYGEDLLRQAFSSVLRERPGAGLVLFGPGLRPRPAGDGPVLDLGEIAHGPALAVIAACEVFVRPTRADGDALSVREALALGRTVVATSVGHRPSGCLLVPAGEVGGLVRGMLEAARLAGTGARSRRPGADPLERLWGIYQALWAGRPLPSGGREQAQAPTFLP